MKKKWILSHCDLDLWPKVTNFKRVWAIAVCNLLVKTASKFVHPFGWNFVHRHTHTYIHTHKHTHTNTHTDRQTNWSKNITPPRFCGGVIKIIIKKIHLPVQRLEQVTLGFNVERDNPYTTGHCWKINEKAVRPNKKIAVFGAPRPTLRFWADPTTFFSHSDEKNQIGKDKENNSWSL